MPVITRSFNHCWWSSLENQFQCKPTYPFTQLFLIKCLLWRSQHIAEQNHAHLVLCLPVVFITTNPPQSPLLAPIWWDMRTSAFGLRCDINRCRDLQWVSVTSLGLRFSVSSMRTRAVRMPSLWGEGEGQEGELERGGGYTGQGDSGYTSPLKYLKWGRI